MHNPVAGSLYVSTVFSDGTGLSPVVGVLIDNYGRFYSVSELHTAVNRMINEIILRYCGRSLCHLLLSMRCNLLGRIAQQLIDAASQAERNRERAEC